MSATLHTHSDNLGMRGDSLNALINHKWGVSPAQDRVWAQVTGLAPDVAVRRLLMALEYQAFIDGSSRPPDGDFVLGGYIATAETWAQFSKDWEQLLPLGTRAKNGKMHFKMSEMAHNPERMARVPLFWKVIEKCSLTAISCRVNHVDFSNAKDRVKEFMMKLSVSVDFRKWDNPYYFLFRMLMDRFHDQRENLNHVFSAENRVDFIFDQQNEKSFILTAWDEIVANRPEEAQKHYGATPRFEDDQEFLPLQAADFWAWWVREWYEEDNADVPDKMRNLDFGTWKGVKKGLPVIAISHTEEAVVDMMQSIVVANLADNFYART